MSESNPSNPGTPPADLPADPAAFWGETPGDLLPAPQAGEIPVLDQLGAAPFKKPDKGGFPFLGFLASVYEHVSSQAATLLQGGSPTPPALSDVAPATHETFVNPDPA